MPKYNLNDVLMAYRADAHAASREIQNSARPRKLFIRFDSIQLRPYGRLARYRLFCARFCVLCAYVICDEFFDILVAFSFKSTTLLLSETETQVKKLIYVNNFIDSIYDINENDL